MSAAVRARPKTFWTSFLPGFFANSVMAFQFSLRLGFFHKIESAPYNQPQDSDPANTAGRVR